MLKLSARGIIKQTSSHRDSVSLSRHLHTPQVSANKRPRLLHCAHLGTVRTFAPALAHRISCRSHRCWWFSSPQSASHRPANKANYRQNVGPSCNCSTYPGSSPAPRVSAPRSCTLCRQTSEHGGREREAGYQALWYASTSATSKNA